MNVWGGEKLKKQIYCFMCKDLNVENSMYWYIIDTYDRGHK